MLEGISDKEKMWNILGGAEGGSLCTFMQQTTNSTPKFA